METSLDYVAVGGNLNPSAADWHLVEHVLAFGAGKNIALWQPCNETNEGIYAVLKAHDDIVTAVRFLEIDKNPPVLVSGSEDATLHIWKPQKVPGYPISFEAIRSDRIQPAKRHAASITCIATSNDRSGIFATGSADGTVIIWKLRIDELKVDYMHMQTLKPDLHITPLSLAIHPVETGLYILAVGGTCNNILLYSSTGSINFGYQALLKGHEGWIRALTFAQPKTTEAKLTGEVKSECQETFLASASQDRYIRIWRILRSCPEKSDYRSGTNQPDNNATGFALSSKFHQLSVGNFTFAVLFDSLLAGHDDWIYSLHWFLEQGRPRLLSASADNSLILWAADTDEGVWYANQRLGELSAQKGSTTATGSMGGFYNALLDPSGSIIVSLCRTGSWRKWIFSKDSQEWRQDAGISGHSRAVRGVSWSRNGAFLLSTSADQTTRLHARWADFSSWHEFSRPQIHGFDLNCIGTVGDNQFVSGAEEKLLRVFDEPDDVARMLQEVCGVAAPSPRDIGSAGIPVLGLSNKAEKRSNDDESERPDHVLLPGTPSRQSQPKRPPTEDHLAKASLWPEREKLYGHGFEVSALAVSHDGQMIATSCKASSLDHAVIRIFSTINWQQQSPALQAHSLTVTSMSFSANDLMLVSVGRDRKWVIWQRCDSQEVKFALKQSETKAHSRMIQDVTWISLREQSLFVTGGRDKMIKIWQDHGKSYQLQNCAETDHAVLSLAALHQRNSVVIASGLEDGCVMIHGYREDVGQLEILSCIHSALMPAGPVTNISWRPSWSEHAEDVPLREAQLAIASDDHTLRILTCKFKVPD